MKAAALAGVTCLLGGSAMELISPLGLELGSSTIKQVSSRYRLNEESGRSHTNGQLFVVPTYQLPAEGIKHAILAFDDSGKLDAATITVEIEHWGEVFETFKENCELVNTNDPLPGNRTALFRLDSSEVSIHAPLIGDEMTVNYMTQKFTLARLRSAAELES